LAWIFTTSSSHRHGPFNQQAHGVDLAQSAAEFVLVHPWRGVPYRGFPLPIAAPAARTGEPHLGDRERQRLDLVDPL
jgi:hypothetical protein